MMKHYIEKIPFVKNGKKSAVYHIYNEKREFIQICFTKKDTKEFIRKLEEVK